MSKHLNYLLLLVKELLWSRVHNHVFSVKSFIQYCLLIPELVLGRKDTSVTLSMKTISIACYERMYNNL